MSIQKERLAEIVGLPNDVNLTEEMVLQAAQQYVDAGVMRTALLDVFGLTKSTPNRVLIERVKRLEAEESARVGGNDFAQRVQAMVKATNMPYEQAVDTIAQQDKARGKAAAIKAEPQPEPAAQTEEAPAQSPKGGRRERVNA